MRKVLSYTLPPIRCFLHHAYPLGVFWDEEDKEVMKWFCANYNYLFSCSDPEDYIFSFLVDYHNVPFLQKRSIFGDELIKILNKYTFFDVVKEFIDSNLFVEIISDEFFSKDSESYKKEHNMHEVMILGYDDAKKTFIVRKYIRDGFKELEVPNCEVVPFENGPYYGDNIALKLYSRKYDMFELTPEMFWLQIKDYYESINPYDKIGNFYGNIFLIWKNKVFGLKAIEIMYDIIKNQENLDIRFFRMIYEHYYCMKKKFLFIREENYPGYNISDDILKFYFKMEETTLLNFRLSVKHNITMNKLTKLKLRNKILNCLQKNIDEERKCLKGLLKDNGY